jgi:hypothetical protein
MTSVTDAINDINSECEFSPEYAKIHIQWDYSKDKCYTVKMNILNPYRI